MQPPDTEAIEQAAWQDFVKQLAEHLAGQWPAMPERLGARYAAFVELTVQQALDRGLLRAVSVARYANLCFVWGPAFQDKPGFDWAKTLLAAPAQQQWQALHQLVQRSLLELQRLPETRIEPQVLTRADDRVVEVFGSLGQRGKLHPSEPPPAPRRACDLEAAELRLLEAAVTQHYTLVGGQWQRESLAAVAPLRIAASSPAPPLVGVLANPPGLSPATRLQWRTRTHALCDADLHPALHYAGTHGLWDWQGHETRAVSWPVATLQQDGPAAGPGTAIAEETTPDIFKLDCEVCGLRDEGQAQGPVTLPVWIWPAAQWWLELRRQAAQAPDAAGQGGVQAHTRCRVECDGQAQDATPLIKAFEQGLDGAAEQARQALLGAWSQAQGLGSPRLEGGLALLVGKAALTWGWQLGAAGLGGRALMRLLGEIDMQLAKADLVFEGELALAEACSRLQLRCVGAAVLRLSPRREALEPALQSVLGPASGRFSLPFEARVVPLASDCGALLQAAGPCTGSLVGEAGLRPRTSGGSGWEWFATLRVEAVSLPLALVDPVLGRSHHELELIAAQPLLDWRLG